MPKSELILFSIDVGTDLVGYATLRVTPSKWERISSGTIKAGGASLAVRLWTLADQLEQRIRAAGAKIAAIETGFVQFQHRDRTGRVWSNPVSNLTLSEGRGAARVAAIRGGVLEVLEVSPSEAKRAATGKGNADKGLVGRMVQAQCRMTYQPDEDEGDAIAVGIHAAGQLQSLELREIYFDLGGAKTV